MRNIPGRPWLRASVGAWNDEGDLERLLEALSDMKPAPAEHPARPRRSRSNRAKHRRRTSMNSVPAASDPATPAADRQRARRGAGREARRSARPRASHDAAARAATLGSASVVALSAVLNMHRLSQNGYANIFYSAGVKSMLRSLHNFLFVSFDPGGLVTVDKPPLGLWVQAASAKVFGFSPLSLLLPEALMGVLAVGAAVRMLARRFGPLAGLARRARPGRVPVVRGGLARQRRRPAADPADGARLRRRAARAAKRAAGGRCCSARVLVGLAFNTKTLAAYLVVPGIVLAYLVCAPGIAAARASCKLLVAGLVMVAVSFSWIALRGTHARLQAPVRGQLDQQLRARADVRIQRLRARGRPDRRARAGSR